MKIQIKFIFLLSLMLFGNLSSRGQVIEAMTFNIRYDNPEDGINRWAKRKEGMVALFNTYHPEIIGLQEGLFHQLQYLDSCLNGYTYFGIGREDGKTKGEFAAIFYDTTALSLISGSTFWLSGEPDRVSVGWDAALERICTYALFELKETKLRFWVFNTHFDHVGVNAREMSALLVLSRMEALNPENKPVIFMGDFNCEPGSFPVKLITEKLADGAIISKTPLSGPATTFNGFTNDSIPVKRIDYIFVSGFNVISYSHIDDKTKDHRYISDHYPVLVQLKLSSD